FVRGNRVLLREIVMNLVENAIRYAGRGAVATLSADAVDGIGRILVADTGPGLPAPDRARLFQRFARGAGTRAEGTGLGLTIVAEVAEMFGGFVTLPDPDAPGFRIAVLLPLDPEA
ncbi:MAG: sensor histidine kinase, partial [Paracoccaceae bacterium]|nr:sensor histidine kinase [Paracoccaceae bacterium]